MINIKGLVSYNLDKNILFDKINYGENFVIFYSNTNNHKRIFQNFMQSRANTNSILFYVSHSKNQLNFDFDVRNYYFNILNKDTIHKLENELNKCFNEVEKNNIPMLLVCDWSNLDFRDNTIFIPFIETLIKRSQGLNPPPWKRRYKQKIREKTPVTIVNAFETTNLDDKFIQQIIQLHERVYLLQENTNTFLLPMISPYSETIFPKYHALPQEVLEKLVKDNLELITLLMLEKNEKSGYQVLKEIANHFHCILSQGTLYPLLYKLERENKIVKQNGKGREVIYSLTQKTKGDFQLKKESCLEAYQHLASFFSERGEAKDLIKQINKVNSNKN